MTMHPHNKIKKEKKEPFQGKYHREGVSGIYDDEGNPYDDGKYHMGLKDSLTATAAGLDILWRKITGNEYKYEDKHTKHNEAKKRNELRLKNARLKEDRFGNVSRNEAIKHNELRLKNARKKANGWKDEDDTEKTKNTKKILNDAFQKQKGR